MDTCQAGMKSTRQGYGAGPDVYATNSNVNRIAKLLRASPRPVGISLMPRSTSVVYHLTLLILVVGFALAFCGFAMARTAEPRSTSTQPFPA